MITQSQPLTVVVSRGNSKNPAKRELEEGLAQALVDQGVRVLIIQNLYDMKPTGETVERLRSLEGDFVVCAWMFERAAHWVLDRNNIRGIVGTVEVRSEEDDDELDDALEDEVDEKARVADGRPQPHRTIYCLDLRIEKEVQPYVEEVLRIAQLPRAGAASDTTEPLQGTAADGEHPADEKLADWIQGEGTPEQLARFLKPTNDNALANSPNESSESPTMEVINENTGRRWYPVIDFSRCTNCMECIDFCLFGVYGVDSIDTILVEQPDNCRKGCPACSRVCPENAIIFPQHKTPTIAGAPSAVGGLKIDLSLLFGAPDAQKIASVERDEQLLLAGRDPVGKDDLAKRQEKAESSPKDELDDLIDSLDELDV